MKKKLLAALAALTILSLAACSYENHTSVEANVNNSGSILTVETSDGNKETTVRTETRPTATQPTQPMPTPLQIPQFYLSQMMWHFRQFRICASKKTAVL